jgi:hypothetical protein
MEAVLEEKKSYQIRKNAESGKFQILNPDTGTLLEGFEEKEFGSPIEGERFMKATLKVIDESAQEMNSVKTQSVPFQIPVIEGKDPVIIIEGKTRYFEVTIREHDEPKRTSEPITDGFNVTYHVALGKKIILPLAVINTAKEAVYTIIQTDQDTKTLKCTTTYRETPRFSVDVGREVTADEAVKWLKEQRKTNINIF